MATTTYSNKGKYNMFKYLAFALLIAAAGYMIAAPAMDTIAARTATINAYAQ